ncbi:TPA: hypothetical protein NIE10_006439, partial [Pseudomonas aeruginosa]|nr:hypothetical protein [Pseudomonas aeruginosa]
EGATHWKKEGDYWFYWIEGTNKWFHGPSCNVSAEREAKFEARPQEAWDGQGLPPVGIECETWHVCKPGDITVRKILFVGQSLVVMSDEFRGEVTGRLEKVQFRPIRTPEQIAAEEREKVAKDMATLMTGHEDHKGEWGCYVILGEILYDAGYRRQEEGK